ncbi:MAG TPA: phosphatase PAP2 family protein [Dehalococcoidia bacterium]|nr:phosphatase PAP2 family protein [Dehalococcoidia bacterium]
MAVQSVVVARKAERWFWPLWLGACGVAIALTLAARATAHFPGDVRLAVALQALEWPGEDALVRLENLLGNGLAPAAIMLLATMVFLLTRRFVACLALQFSTAMWSLVTVLKEVAQRPRPAPALVAVHERATGYSFPSGHVFTSLMLYGALAALVAVLPLPRWLRLSVRACCLGIVLLMGFARIDVGAHWPSDVLGGYLWGAIVLSAILRLLIWRGGRARLPRSPALAAHESG